MIFLVLAYYTITVIFGLLLFIIIYKENKRNILCRLRCGVKVIIVK